MTDSHNPTLDMESPQAILLEEAYQLGYHKVKDGCLIKPLERLNALIADEVVKELEKLMADTLSPENFGGRFVHEPVTEFARQQKKWIEERISELRKERE